VVVLAVVVRSEQAFAWVKLCRFRVTTVYPVVALSGVALVSKSLSQALLPMVSIVLVAMGVYIANDIFDLEEDRINDPDRPLPRGIVSVRSASLAAGICLVAGVTLAAIRPSVLPFVLLFAVVGLAYSVPHIRLKKYMVLPYVVIGSFGFFSFMAGALWVSQIDGRALFLGLIMFAIFTGNSTVKEFKDVEGDMKRGSKTLPLVIGLKPAARLSAGLMLSLSPVLLVTYFLYDLNLIYPIAFIVLYVPLVWTAASFLKNPNDLVRARKYYINSIVVAISQFVFLIVSALTS